MGKSPNRRSTTRMPSSATLLAFACTPALLSAAPAGVEITTAAASQPHRRLEHTRPVASHYDVPVFEVELGSCRDGDWAWNQGDYDTVNNIGYMECKAMCEARGDACTGYEYTPGGLLQPLIAPPACELHKTKLTGRST